MNTLIILTTLIISSLPGAAKMDPKIDLYLRNPQFRNIIMNPSGRFSRDLAVRDHATVTVRVTSIDDLAALRAMECEHFSILRRKSGEVRVGRVVAAKVTLKGAAMLKHASFVERVELDRPAHAPFPTDVTTRLITAPQTWGALDSLGIFATGKGIKVGDLDSGLDVFQPAFFFGDGGFFDWIDVNENGTFDPGIDAVDHNRDGLAGEDEVLGYLDIRMYSYWDTIDYIQGQSQGYGAFQANIDYLYKDENQNGTRDADFDTGASSDSPSLGEPFFIADDVNGNGLLDPGERIIMLSTSKVLAYFNDNTVYERGTDLRNVPRNEDVSHGTGVLGITAGGHKGHGLRHGIAPEAELLVGNAYGETGYFQVMQWMLSEGAEVVIHEFANNFGNFLDGTSNVEVAMDDSAAAGVVHVAAAGNHGGSSKGYKSTIAPGELRNIGLHLPGGSAAPAYAQITLLWRDNTQFFGLSLTDPTGVVFDADTSMDMTEAAPNIWYYVVWDQSDSGTVMADIVLFGYNGSSYVPLNGGDYTLSIQHPDGGGAPITVAGFSTDMDSGWGEGFKWLEDVTEEHLIGWPGTADSAVTVAAYVGRDEPEIDYYGQTQGELRDYSGRGYRIDGQQIMDVAAPANPLAPTCLLCTSDPNRYGNMSVFGGTSGATPHVGGAAVLLKQLYPSENGLEIMARIREGALVDSDVTAPGNRPQEEMWGAGKLRIWEAAFETDAHTVSPPEIESDSLSTTVNAPLTITPAVSDMETPAADLRVRFDVDYDGEYDTEFLLNKSTEVTFAEVGQYVVKAQVVDAQGFTDEALIFVTVTAGDQPDAGVDGGTDGGGDDGCSCHSAGARGATGHSILWLLLAAVALGVVRRFAMDS